ncbi:SGNH/GDSL hydrolase family protein [Sphingomonas gellani]|nr:SGNH/GDSL hydrolase family protein [Sphingomonas gellani]
MAQPAPAQAALIHTANAQRTWIASWGSAQQIPEDRNTLPDADLRNATLRQVVRLSVGGTRLRVRVSNAFGREALRIAGAHVARSADKATARIVPGTDTVVTFSGARGVTIPPGADFLSDPVTLSAPALSSIAVTMAFDAPPAGQTGHPGSRATSYLLHGDHLSDADLPGAKPVEHWYQLTGVEVETGAAPATVVALGNSITDGRGATTNGDDRWPDVLAGRLHAAKRDVSVVNMGIGGNHLLTDGLGPNVLARLDRDVFARPGVRTLVVFEGVNDLGMLSLAEVRTPEQHQQLVAAMIAAYRQIADRAHAQGVRVIGCTVTPYVGSDYYHPDAASEADRQAVNRWIRTGGAFDHVVDLDAVTRDPAHPDRLLPRYDSGDHLHPSAAGYAAIGAAFPLDQLAPASAPGRHRRF